MKLLTIFGGVLVALCCVGCGSGAGASSGEATTDAGAVCSLDLGDQAIEVVRLENSGLSCAGAKGIVYTLPKSGGSFSVNTPDGVWVCAQSSKGHGDLKVHCRRGGRHFVTERKVRRRLK